MFKHDCDYGCIYFSNYSEFIYRVLLARFTNFSKIMREKKAVGLKKPRVVLIFVLINSRLITLLSVDMQYIIISLFI